jgi:hypothetical protein
MQRHSVTPSREELELNKVSRALQIFPLYVDGQTPLFSPRQASPGVPIVMTTTISSMPMPMIIAMQCSACDPKADGHLLYRTEDRTGHAGFALSDISVGEGVHARKLQTEPA